MITLSSARIYFTTLSSARTRSRSEELERGSILLSLNHDFLSILNIHSVLRLLTQAPAAEVVESVLVVRIVLWRIKTSYDVLLKFFNIYLHNLRTRLNPMCIYIDIVLILTFTSFRNIQLTITI